MPSSSRRLPSQEYRSPQTTEDVTTGQVVATKTRDVAGKCFLPVRRNDSSLDSRSATSSQQTLETLHEPNPREPLLKRIKTSKSKKTKLVKIETGSLIKKWKESDSEEGRPAALSAISRLVIPDSCSHLSVYEALLEYALEDKENLEAWDLFDRISRNNPLRRTQQDPPSREDLSDKLGEAAIDTSLETKVREKIWKVWENIFEENPNSGLPSEVIEILDNFLFQEIPMSDEEVIETTMLLIQVHCDKVLFSDEDRLIEALKGFMTERNFESKPHIYWIDLSYMWLRSKGPQTKSEALAGFVYIVGQLERINCVYSSAEKVEEQPRQWGRVVTRDYVMITVLPDKLLFENYRRETVDRILMSDITNHWVEGDELVIEARRKPNSLKYRFAVDRMEEVNNEIEQFRRGSMKRRFSESLKSFMTALVPYIRIWRTRVAERSRTRTSFQIERRARPKSRLAAACKDRSICPQTGKGIEGFWEIIYRLFNNNILYPMKRTRNIKHKHEALRPGATFRTKYQIMPRGNNFPEKSNLVPARHIYNRENIVLKFYESEEIYENVKEIYQRVNCDQICTMIDPHDKEDGYLDCVAFERGKFDLRRWISKKPLMLERLSTLYQILKALFHLHQKEIVHGDLKPSNIVLFEESKWKVIDLDLAHDFGRPPSSIGMGLSEVYAPPEIADLDEEERNNEHRSGPYDMWCFGLVAYEVLTGNPLIGVDGEKAISDISSLGESGEKLDAKEKDLKNLIEACLRTDPSSRCSVNDALENGLFDIETKTPEEIRRQLTRETSRTEMDNHWRSIYTENLEVKVVVEDFISDSDKDKPLFNRSYTMATREMRTDQRSAYLLALQRDYGIKFTIQSRDGSALSFSEVLSVEIQPEGEDAFRLRDLECKYSKQKCTGMGLFKASEMKGTKMTTLAAVASNDDSSFFAADVKICLLAARALEIVGTLTGRIYLKMQWPEGHARELPGGLENEGIDGGRLAYSTTTIADPKLDISRLTRP